MEGNALSTFLTNIGTVFTQLLTWLGSVATSLLSNEIFQVMVAIIIFIMLYGLVVGLARSIKGRKGKRR